MSNAYTQNVAQGSLNIATVAPYGRRVQLACAVRCEPRPHSCIFERAGPGTARTVPAPDLKGGFCFQEVSHNGTSKRLDLVAADVDSAGVGPLALIGVGGFGAATSAGVGGFAGVGGLAGVGGFAGVGGA